MNREIPKHEQENIKLAELIREYDDRFCHILGYRCMTAWINHFNRTSFSEFKIPNNKKKLYLSARLDLYDKNIVSYVICSRNDNNLVFPTFDKAVVAKTDAKTVFHNDSRFQYTSKVFQAKLRENEMKQSISRVGHYIDNGPTEGL